MLGYQDTGTGWFNNGSEENSYSISAVERWPKRDPYESVNAVVIVLNVMFTDNVPPKELNF